MQIIHRIDDFLEELFPEYVQANKDLSVLKQNVESYYTYGFHKPKVSIDGDWITIEIDTSSIIRQETEFRKVISLCESGKYEEAKKLLIPLIKINPANSEYYRIYGQILSDEGDQEEAINSLIDALKWDPKNGYALVMMGNIFARYKDDIETAMKYYNQALKINPDDHIAINNIGANLLQLNKTKEGVDYLEKAYAINPLYPNTTYGLSLAYDKLGYPRAAFDYAIQCVKSLGKSTDPMYRAAYSSAVTLSNELCKTSQGMQVFEEYKSLLVEKTGIEIRVETDDSLPTAAKIEFAENHNRDYHLIKYKPNYPAVEHLLMHELVHLEFAQEAREEKLNMLFLSGRDKRILFIKDNEATLKKLNREGYDDSSITKFIDALYDGINRQIFNTPIDLFIEDFLYENYQEIQPFQFVSINQLINEGKTAVTNKAAEKITPKLVLSASKILNVVNALQFKDLYGIDYVSQFNALSSELKVANSMWAEFLEYRKDRSPGEEYELVEHWGKDLHLDNYFELVDEEDFRNRPQSVEEVLQSIEEDPFGLDVDKNFKEKETQTFLKSQEELGINMAVMWFMVSALQFFRKMQKEKIKSIAFEIALIGTQGINPAQGHSYKVPSIPNKEFSGYNLLAYYYVSWKLAIPDMLKQLQLPYDKEYELAKQTFDSGSK